MLVKLYYNRNEYYNYEQFINDKPSFDRVLEYPAVEMVGSSFGGWANDFLESTLADVVIERTPKQGDLIICGATVLLYINKTEQLDQNKIEIPDNSELCLIKLQSTPAENARILLEHNEGDYK